MSREYSFGSKATAMQWYPISQAMESGERANVRGVSLVKGCTKIHIIS